MDNINQTTHNPDVLSCLANLSNDEVFTPPKLANEVLDLLPSDIWSNPSITFLDPCCKTGVFLREITIRLLEGLKDEIPDLQERVNHILTKQVFGIAITELTALMTRRTLYCSKNANGKYSICTDFGNSGGNIYYNPKVNHQWKNGKCILCGASQELWQRDDKLESYAYAFIHKPIKELFNMKFDVIIGNPPYQLGTGNGPGASPLYHKFVQQAKKLGPKYITMIIPSRWFTTGKGLKEFRIEMINDRRIKELHDFINASDCFNDVEIKGGICYFLWDKDYNEKCSIFTYEKGEVKNSKRFLSEPGLDIFIRDWEAINILNKVKLIKSNSFSEIVSSQAPFGLYSNFKDYLNTPFENSIKIYMNKKVGYIRPDQILKNKEMINCYKMLFTESFGEGNPKKDWLKPIIPEYKSVCTQTYLTVGPFESEEELNNCFSYTQTKLFHFLVSLNKITQHANPQAYSLVPMQDFSKPWTDKELYEKYGLSQDEIDYIESMIRPMDNKEE